MAKFTAAIHETSFQGETSRGPDHCTVQAFSSQSERKEHDMKCYDMFI